MLWNTRTFRYVTRPFCNVVATVIAPSQIKQLQSVTRWLSGTSFYRRNTTAILVLLLRPISLRRAQTKLNSDEYKGIKKNGTQAGIWSGLRFSFRSTPFSFSLVYIQTHVEVYGCFVCAYDCIWRCMIFYGCMWFLIGVCTGCAYGVAHGFYGVYPRFVHMVLRKLRIS